MRFDIREPLLDLYVCLNLLPVKVPGTSGRKVPLGSDHMWYTCVLASELYARARDCRPILGKLDIN